MGPKCGIIFYSKRLFSSAKNTQMRLRRLDKWKWILLEIDLSQIMEIFISNVYDKSGDC